MKKFSTKNGVLVYSIQGSGAKNFLLVHNCAGNHQMMQYSTAHFSKQGKTLTPDLFGHGMSSAPKREYTLAAYANDMIALCKHEKMEKVIFIGLNYGANLGIEIQKLCPDLISFLILIEPPIFMDSWIVRAIEDQIKEKEPIQAADLFVKVSSREEQIADSAMKKTPSFVKSSAYKHLLEWDQTAKPVCQIPTLLIQTKQPFCAEEKPRTIFPNLQIGKVIGSGPWANLEVPEQVHPMIDRFLSLEFFCLGR